MSEIGSEVVTRCPLPLPASLDYARDFSRKGEFPETDPAQMEFTDIAARPAAAEATVPMPACELRLLDGILGNLGGCGHLRFYSPKNHF
jgi:hypothetical protein